MGTYDNTIRWDAPTALTATTTFDTDNAYRALQQRLVDYYNTAPSNPPMPDGYVVWDASVGSFWPMHYDWTTHNIEPISERNQNKINLFNTINIDLNSY